ncbi:MAG: BMC domain-containing protein [Acidimicrobiia bacterium]
MSDAPPPPAASLDPAVGILEFSSIAVGIVAGDAMVKAAPLGSIYAGTVHPGKYLVLVSGDTAPVEVALDAGRDVGEDWILDRLFLPDIHPAVTAAITAGGTVASLDGEALGIVETVTVATVVQAADAGVKAARVDVSAVRLADGLGGKGYVLFSGHIADVEAAVEAARDWADDRGHLVEARIVAQLHDEMGANLASDLRFRRRAALRPVEREA